MNYVLPGMQYCIQSDVVYWGSSQVKGADPRSFTALNEQWGIDKKGVYSGDTRMRKVDRESFEVLNALFARDANNVYYIMGVAKGIAPGDFEVLDPGFWTDEVRGDPQYHGYAKNSESIFFLDRMSGKPRAVRGADPDSFERLKYDYARDAKRAYYYGWQIKKCVAAEFEPLSPVYSKDSKRVYYAGQEIDGADSASFEVVPVPRGHYHAVFGRDSRHVYYVGKVLEHAVPATFKVLDEHYESDGRHHFRWGDPVESLPADLNF